MCLYLRVFGHESHLGLHEKVVVAVVSGSAQGTDEDHIPVLDNIGGLFVITPARPEEHCDD